MSSGLTDSPRSSNDECTAQAELSDYVVRSRRSQDEAAQAGRTPGRSRGGCRGELSVRGYGRYRTGIGEVFEAMQFETPSQMCSKVHEVRACRHPLFGDTLVALDLLAGSSPEGSLVGGGPGQCPWRGPLR